MPKNIIIIENFPEKYCIRQYDKNGKIINMYWKPTKFQAYYKAENLRYKNEEIKFVAKYK